MRSLSEIFENYGTKKELRMTLKLQHFDSQPHFGFAAFHPKATQLVWQLPHFSENIECRDSWKENSSENLWILSAETESLICVSCHFTRHLILAKNFNIQSSSFEEEDDSRTSHVSIACQAPGQLQNQKSDSEQFDFSIFAIDHKTARLHTQVCPEASWKSPAAIESFGL